MIGRFGLSKGSNNDAAPIKNGSFMSMASGASLGISSSSMPSLSGFSSGISSTGMKLGSMAKKVTTLGQAVDGMEHKNKVEDRRKQIAQAMQIFDEISLQAPPSHLGLIVAYAGKFPAPIINSGVKFTWFRMRGEDQVDQVDESTRAWYAPTVDDVGCTICVQCEDNYDQGLSKYLECGPLKVDNIVRSAAESAINTGSYETKGVCVSFGLSETEAADTASSIFDVASTTQSLPDLYSTLSQENAFLQLNGRCTVEVDPQGLFISIPTHQPFQKGGSTGNMASKATFNTGRRGLRIPSSAGLSVHCVAHSTVLIMSVPLYRKSIAAESQDDDVASSIVSNSQDEASEPSTPRRSDNKDSQNDNGKEPAALTAQEGKGKGEEDAMKQFLSSSILAIPWTYEGHTWSPEAYIAERGDLTPDERERILKEAEEDSITFANTVVALAEFISSVPDGAEKLLVCISCPDRLSRDTLCLSIRSVACHHQTTGSNINRLERRLALPWIHPDGSDNTDMIIGSVGNDHNQNQQEENELKKRLKSVEEETASLKRERNELTKQLLIAREESAQQRLQHQRYIAELQADHHQQQQQQQQQVSSSVTKNDDEKSDVLVAKIASQPVAVAIPTDGSEHGSSSSDTNTTELRQKLIELETQLQLALQREQESNQQRSELETQLQNITTDLESSKRKRKQDKERHTAQQINFDQQSQFMSKLEKEIERLREHESTLESQLLQQQTLEHEISQRDAIATDLKRELQTAQSDIANFKELSDAQLQLITALKADFSVKIKTAENTNQHLETQLSSSMTEIKRRERDLLTLQEEVAVLQAKVAEVDSLKEAVAAAENRNEQLAAEMNALQRKAESQARDLKKSMKENAAALAEFEKALIRKSDECNVLYFKINEMKDIETTRASLTEDGSIGSAGFMSKLSSAFASNGTTASNGSKMGGPSLHGMLRRLSRADSNYGASSDDGSSNNGSDQLKQSGL